MFYSFNNQPRKRWELTISNTSSIYRKTIATINVATRAVTQNAWSQVSEQDLGLDTFKDQVDKNKQHFVTLIEEIVESMTKEK